MPKAALVQRLTEGIASLQKGRSFCVSGSFPKIAPGLQVAGLGPIGLPLKPSAAKRLLAEGTPASYGKGTQTLIDTSVRNAFAWAPKRFTITNPQWDQAIQQVTRASADQLGLPGERLEAHLYKLLVYGKGGFFLRHRDSEKHDRMVGSLIVALPSVFEGGTLTVRHHGQSQRIDFKEAASGQAPCYAAFYADCEHEVSKVTRGCRLCLAYNLVLRPGNSEERSLASPRPAAQLAQALEAWCAQAAADPLVFALDHHYTKAGLALDLLKGNDRDLADLVVAAADEAGCHAYLCQIARHLVQYADDGRWEKRWSYSRAVPEDLSVGEVYQDELLGTEWVDEGGTRQHFPDISLNTANIIASTPVDQWKPTREEYEGYTGNEGNTLERWYHRSALCVWHHERHFEVLARASFTFALTMFSTLVAKLKKVPKKRLEEARYDCIGLAQAIIQQWPARPPHAYSRKALPTDLVTSFPELLLQLDDVDTTRALLQCVGQRKTTLELGNFIEAMCRTHGCATFADELVALFDSKRESPCGSEFAWIDQLATARFDDPARDELLAKLAPLAVQRFCRPASQRHDDRAEAPVAAETLLALLRILHIAGADAMLDEVVRFVSADTRRFSLQHVQVPSLQSLVAWCRKAKRALHPRMVAWLQALKQDLTAATSAQPQPPADWARPAEIACTCEYCRRLNAFLADPQAATGRIPARDDRRGHLLSEVRAHDCDVTYKLEKTGSPYALVFTKTDGSFKRRADRYAADLKLLGTVQELLSLRSPSVR